MLPDRLQKSYDKAVKLDASLRADDPRFDGGVVAVHEEGSVFVFRHAFALIDGDNVIILTEHQGFRVFAEEELSSLTCYVGRAFPEVLDE